MGKFDNISDEELIARLRDGETIIEDYLMEKYKGLVRQKARAMSVSYTHLTLPTTPYV